MIGMAGRLIGFGYQGRTPDELVAEMVEAGASRLVDVRLNPVSRVRGFSKNRLRERLEASGLVYEHRPELGNPKDNRAGYAEPETLAAHRAHARFRDSVLSTPSADSALARLADLVADGETVFLLCFERDQACCHRQQVIDAVDAVRLEAALPA